MTAEVCSKSMQDLTAKAAKAARITTDSKLKRDGNKRQYKHNQDVLDEVEGAERCLEEGKVDRAKEKLKNGKELLRKYLKKVKIADREELGWQVVKFYESDDLASDSEDEKTLNRARREAAAADKKRDAKRKERRRSPTRRRYFPTRNFPSRNYSAGSSKGKSSLICYGCNREGHTRRFCFASAEKNKV